MWIYHIQFVVNLHVVQVELHTSYSHRHTVNRTPIIMCMSKY